MRISLTLPTYTKRMSFVPYAKRSNADKIHEGDEEKGGTQTYWIHGDLDTGNKESEQQNVTHIDVVETLRD